MMPRFETRKKSFALPAVLMGALMISVVPGPAGAAVEAETAFVFNTLLLLIGGFLVMWMAAGFCMLEAGLVRSKNVADICLKNVALYALAGIMYYLIGYRLMYDGVDGGFIGRFGFWSPDDGAALSETPDFSGNYAASADWFFQMAFVATAASIVSGTVAERVRLLPFLAFSALLSGLVYPVLGAWHWGGGWLSGLGFKDFAGSTIVHSTGGWAALAGALILGPRVGKYDAEGRPRAIPGSSLPLAALGTFILWFGWFGFNGASELALGSAADAVTIARVFANTNMAAAGGVVTAMILSRLLYGKVDLTMTLNGALAGLVAITAEPSTPGIGLAILIGGVAAALVVLAVPLIDRLGIDDVVGAISVHLVGGIWGTLAVVLSNPEASLKIQLVGILAIGAFASLMSALIWTALKRSLGIRLDPEAEHIGSDIAELGLEAWPEFGSGSQKLRSA